MIRLLLCWAWSWVAVSLMAVGWVLLCIGGAMDDPDERGHR